MRVIVLGAGVIGTTCAYYLAKTGHEVTVVERRDGPALETSFANAGEVSPGYSAPWAGPGVPLKAMVLLGINCGFGNTDCANLPLTALDLDRGWLNYPRPKTGTNRRCHLWPETGAALRNVEINAGSITDHDVAGSLRAESRDLQARSDQVRAATLDAFRERQSG